MDSGWGEGMGSWEDLGIRWQLGPLVASLTPFYR